MAVELLQLRQVVALAEHGSFVRAATALHMSQPALSRSIQNLEARIGSELFLRASSGVIPTDLGRLYIERARDVLRMADELDREAASHGSFRTGRVAVGGGPYPAEAVLAPAAARFVEQFPGVSVRLQARDWDDLARALRSRELDFFVAETSTLLRQPDLAVAPMAASHAVYFVVRAEHPLARHARVAVAEAFAWPVVTPGRVPPRILDPMLASHRDAVRSVGTPRPFPSIECSSLAGVKRIVACSDAVMATTLSCIATELESGRFVLLAREPWMHLQYGIVTLAGLPTTKIADRFREFVLDAERETTQQEEQLVARFAPDRATRAIRPGPRRRLRKN